MIFRWVDFFVKQRWFLWTLFIINLLGTIYGYYWYKNQLAITPLPLIPFVPDSPTASLFFTILLLFLIYGKKTGLLAAFAAITLIKYGIWAVVVNFWIGALGDPLGWQNYMLIFSHASMAIEAVLFYQYYRIKLHHIIIAASWTLINDYLDYTLDIHPWVSYELDALQNTLGWFTFGLSLFSIGIVAYLAHIRRNYL